MRASLGFVWDLLGFTGFYRAYRVLWGFMGVYGIVDRAPGRRLQRLELQGLGLGSSRAYRVWDLGPRSRGL